METDERREEGGSVRPGHCWIRGRYEVKGDYVVPVAGAQLEVYDPIKEYYQRKKAKQRTLVSFLLDLPGLREIPPDVGRDPRSPLRPLTDNFKSVLLAFCNRWGLPGTLLHWQALGPLSPLGGPADPSEFFPGLAEAPTYRRSCWPIDGALLPAPDTEAFWTAYCEPLAPIYDFISRFWTLAWMHVDLDKGGWQRNKPMVADHPEQVATALTGSDLQQWVEKSIAPWVREQKEHFLDSRPQREEAVTEAINRQLSVVNLTLTYEPDPQTRRAQWSHGRHYPSLISFAYDLLKHEMVGGFEPRRCENPDCGRSFIPSRWDVRYCSMRCRKTMEKRMLRRGQYGRRQESGDTVDGVGCTLPLRH